jgi:uncharacterized protein YcfJ
MKDDSYYNVHKKQRRMKELSRTSKIAIGTTAGLIAGRLIGKQLGWNQQMTTVIGGLLGTIAGQPGELKKLLS